MRCSVHLVRELPRGALVLSLFGVRPGVLDAESRPMADMLAAFGGAMLTNATAYGQAQRTASQLKDAVVARSVVDQAKGILMHALGCDAEDALRRLRQESQRRHVKVTEVAAEVVAAYGGEEPKLGGPSGRARVLRASDSGGRLDPGDQDRHVVAQVRPGRNGKRGPAPSGRSRSPTAPPGRPARQPGSPRSSACRGCVPR